MPVRSRGWCAWRGIAVAAVLVVSAAAQGAAPAKAKPFVFGAQPQAAAPTEPAYVSELAPLAKRLPNPPPAKIQQIIETFATNERMFRSLLAHNFTYTESILVQQTDADGHPITNPDGTAAQFQQTNDIVYTPGGGRQIVCTYCPQPSLEQIVITQDDLTDMFNMNMYTFSVDELPEYNVTYLDHQPLDAITAYVFRVQPKKIVKGQRYFDGIVFVDDQTQMIVKSEGRVVPNQYDKHGNPTNTFLPFTVWRQEVDGQYWFPVYTLMQGAIPGGQDAPPVYMRMVIQFKNYKRFGTSSRIISVQAVPQTPPKPDSSKKPAPGKKKDGGGGGGRQ